MVIALGTLLLGAFVLYAGAEAAVRGASGFARAAGIRAFVVGALLFGIDLEGLGTALAAAGTGRTQLAAGEIFGTVLFLFSAAFGAALLLAKEPVPAPSRTMIAAPAIPVIAAALTLYDRFVTRTEGLFLIGLYVAYVVTVIQEHRAEEPAAESEDTAAPAGPSRGRTAAITLGGLALLAIGAALLVAGGVQILERTALTAGFVGAAVVGTLASLDEVLLEVLPIRRGQHDLATGNLFGTLAAFSSGVLGLAAVVRPLDVDGAGALAYLGMAFLYALVGTTFMVRGRAGRLLGAIVLLFYAGWLVLTSTV